MDAVTNPAGTVLEPGFVSLAALAPGTRGHVVRISRGDDDTRSLTELERRLLELGFVDGEPVEVVAEARPGRDPFVVRVGHTTLALRRREAQGIWIHLHRP